MEGEDEFARQALVHNSSEHQAFSLKGPGIGAKTAFRAKVLPTITVLHKHVIGFDCVGSLSQCLLISEHRGEVNKLLILLLLHQDDTDYAHTLHHYALIGALVLATEWRNPPSLWRKFHHGR